MALATSQVPALKQEHSIRITPQMKQQFLFLRVPLYELQELVEAEKEQNPMVEEDAGLSDPEERPRTEERLDESGVEPPSRDATAEVTPENGMSAVDWKDYVDHYDNNWQGGSSGARDLDEERAPSLEATLSRSESLPEYLVWQLGMQELASAELEVAERLIGNLDDDGYLRLSVEEIAFRAGSDFDTVEGALRRIQQLDPPGVGARDLRECLLLQLRARDEGESLAASIVRDHLGALETRRFDAIAKALNVELDAVREAFDEISHLEPKPGRNFGDCNPRYITPDVYLEKHGDDYRVTVNDNGLPRLKVSRCYERLLASGESKDATQYITERLNAAKWLIECIDRRKQTITRVTETIVRFQRDFFDKGVEHLRPLILKQVAEQLDLHESTVSRATVNKYVHTPRGIFELKYFFNSAIKQSDDSGVSSESVRYRVGEIIKGEDRGRPLSDEAVARVLRGEGIEVARRTVAKYRAQLDIPVASARRLVA